MIISDDTYAPGLLFRNKHVNTVFRRVWIKAPITYTRKRIETPDGDFIDLDFNLNGNNRMVLLIHGLEGSSDSEYIKTTVNFLSLNGYDTVAMNLRGCSGTPNLKLQTYHSGKTDDLETVLHHLSENYTYRQLFVVGFSLGGNQILKFLGEQGTKASKLLTAAVSISVPVDLKGAAESLSKSSNRIYMNNFLQRLIPKTIRKAEQFPESGLDAEAIKQCKNFYDFDNLVTAPVFGFKDAHDYWKKNSSKPFLPEIKVPTLLLNAKDDPFLAPNCFPVKETRTHQYVDFYTPEFGGHVGFNSSIVPKNNTWMETQILQFLQKTQ